MSVKNFGLSPNIGASSKDFKEPQVRNDNAERFAKQIKRDLAATVKSVKKVRVKKATQEILTCKTYLCNWQGLSILGNTCPCCGQKLFKTGAQ